MKSWTIAVFASILFITPFVLASGQGPDIREVQRMALDYARIRPDDLSDMRHRTKRAALLPKLQVGAKRVFENDIDITISDNISVNSDGVNIGPETNDVKQSSNSDTSIEVKAVWDLSGVIFSRDLIDIAEEARYQVRERRQILAEVNRLYFERRRLLDELKSATKGLPSIESHVEELTADLDAFTGGWFSRHANGP